MTEYHVASEIMDKNFFGIEDAVTYYGINPLRPKKLSEQVMEDIPFTEKLLLTLKDTHVLVAVFPVSIVDLIRNKGHLFKKHHTAALPWIRCKDAFFKDKGVFTWELVDKEATKKTYDYSAQVLVYVVISHFLKTGERLFKDKLTKTSSRFSDGKPVLIGDFSSCLRITDDDP